MAAPGPCGAAKINGEANGQLQLPAEDYVRLTQVFDRSLIETAFAGG